MGGFVGLKDVVTPTYTTFPRVGVNSKIFYVWFRFYHVARTG